MRRGLILSGLILGLALPGSASASTIDVCPNPGECDFTKIQAAVNAAEQGDTVNVDPGRYQETVIVDKQLEINGAQSGADAREDRSGGESSVGAQNGGFVITDNGKGNDPSGTVIDGFTIFRAGSSGGASTYDAGIAILYDEPMSGFRIVNNIIRDNVFGLQLNSSGDDRTIVKRNLFQANNNDGGEGEEQGNGIYSDILASNVLIDRNVFQSHQNEAMLIKNQNPSIAPPATGIDILGNELDEDSGIVVVNARAVRVAENTSRGNVDDDVIDDDVIEMGGNVDGANITDNRLDTYDGAGVTISDDRGAGVNRNISIVGNTLLGNNGVTSDRGVRLLGDTYDGHLQVAFNRIFRNDFGVTNEDSDTNEQINAENNWWGSNERPGTPPSDSVAGNVDVGPRLQMRLQSKKAVRKNGRQLKVRATFQFNSTDDGGGQRFHPSDFPNGTKVRFTTDRGRIQRRVETIGGVADAVLVTRGSTGRTRITASLDGEKLKRRVRIRG